VVPEAEGRLVNGVMKDVVGVGGATISVRVAVPVDDICGAKVKSARVTVIVIPARAVAVLCCYIVVLSSDEGWRVEGEL